MTKQSQSIEIYRSKEGDVELHVNVENDSLWLTSEQMGSLFGVDRTSVVRHVQNIYKTGELQRKTTCANTAHVAKDGRKRMVDFYNLDMIISVGYRTNSKRGTQFRIWATNTLRQHLIKGYTINEQRLEGAKIQELKSAVSLIKKAMERKALSADESSGLLKVITDYAETWLLLNQFDRGELPAPKHAQRARFHLSVEESRTLIASLKKNLVRQGQAGESFGQEVGDSLGHILHAIDQTHADAIPLASIEERAAHLLYHIIKDRPFADGNKRIAAFLFIIYLTRSQYVAGRDGERKFNDSSLVALVLLIAECEPGQKDLLMRLVMKFVHGSGG